MLLSKVFDNTSKEIGDTLVVDTCPVTATDETQMITPVIAAAAQVGIMYLVWQYVNFFLNL